MKRAVLSLVVLLASAIGTGTACSTPQKGALVLSVSTDMQVPKDFDILSIYVATGSVVKFDYMGRILPDGSVPLPATLAIVEPDDPTAQVHIRVTAFQDALDGAKARVLRDVLTTVPHERIAVLDIPLSFLDDGSGAGTLPSQYVPVGVGNAMAPEGPTMFDPTDLTIITTPLCDFAGAGLTSVYGQCAPALVDSATLRDYHATRDDGQQGDSGGCFDVASCFAGASPVMGVNLAASPCSFPLGQVDPTMLNLALATTDETGVYLSSLASYLVPLSEDPATATPPNPAIVGWSVSGGTVQLAPGVCARLQARAATLLESTSGACPAKALATLECEPSMPTMEGAPDAGLAADSGLVDAGLEDADDATPIDATPGDVAHDSAADGEAGTPVDTGAPADAVADSTLMDSTLMDSSMMDSTIADSSVMDSSTMDSSFGDSAASSDTAMIPVPPPTLTPTSTVSNDDLFITAMQNFPMATICYTLDGSTPTCMNGMCTGMSQTYLPTGMIGINGDVTMAGMATVNAVECEIGYETSAVASASYTLQVAVPTATNPSPGDASIGSDPTIGTTTSLGIVYLSNAAGAPSCGAGPSVDGSGTYSSAFGGPLMMNTTILAIGCKEGYVSSSTSFTYLVP